MGGGYGAVVSADHSGTNANSAYEDTNEMVGVKIQKETTRPIART